MTDEAKQAEDTAATASGDLPPEVMELLKTQGETIAQLSAKVEEQAKAAGDNTALIKAMADMTKAMSASMKSTPMGQGLKLEKLTEAKKALFDDLDPEAMVEVVTTSKGMFDSLEGLVEAGTKRSIPMRQFSPTWMKAANAANAKKLMPLVKRLAALNEIRAS